MLPSAASVFRPDTDATACFSVHAEAEAGIMPRVVELFAKRGLVPTSWISRVHGRELTIDLQMRGLRAEEATYIAQCLRQMISVDVVLISEKR